MMKIINSYNEIMELFQVMDGQFDLELYKKYTKTITPSLFEKLWDDCQDYDFEQDVVPIMELAMNSLTKLTAINDSFNEVVKINLARVQEVAGVEFPVQVLLYLGLCNGAGWATTLDDEPIIMLGVEKMIELDWVSVESVGGLIYHELGHIWHAAIGTMNQSTNGVHEEYLAQLYNEGIAMYFEQLCAGDYDKWSESKGDWWRWCMIHQNEVASEYIRRLDANESCQDFFGDWCSYMGQSNIGYFLGYQLIDHLAQKYSLLELANLTIKTVADEFVAYVK